MSGHLWHAGTAGITSGNSMLQCVSPIDDKHHACLVKSRMICLSATNRSNYSVYLNYLLQLHAFAFTQIPKDGRVSSPLLLPQLRGALLSQRHQSRSQLPTSCEVLCSTLLEVPTKWVDSIRLVSQDQAINCWCYFVPLASCVEIFTLILNLQIRRSTIFGALKIPCRLSNLPLLLPFVCSPNLFCEPCSQIPSCCRSCFLGPENSFFWIFEGSRACIDSPDLSSPNLSFGGQTWERERGTY